MELHPSDFHLEFLEGIAEICRIVPNKGISLIYETVSPIPVKLMKTVAASFDELDW